jgi:hypothetical protein
MTTTDEADRMRPEIYQPACPWHIRVGDLFISPGIQPGRVWIGEVNGAEGGDFDPAALAPVLRKFYDENF